MSSMQQVLAAAPPMSIKGPRRPPGHRHLRGSDCRWAIAFVLPYAAVFLVFVVYPFGYALWMARKPSLYADLIFDPLYPRAIVNTLLFVGLGVNAKMFLAMLLSDFFLRPRWWIRALLAVYVLPWVIAAAQACGLVSLDAAAGGIGQWHVVGVVLGLTARSGSMTVGSPWAQILWSIFGNGCRSGH